MAAAPVTVGQRRAANSRMKEKVSPWACSHWGSGDIEATLRSKAMQVATEDWEQAS